MAGKNERFVLIPHHHDVLTTANGSKVTGNHKGNALFLKLLLTEQNAIVRQHGKSGDVSSMDSARRIMKQIESQDPPGRFLERVATQNRWKVMSKESSTTTTLQYFEKVRQELEMHQKPTKRRKRIRNEQPNIMRAKKRTNPIVIEIDSDDDSVDSITAPSTLNRNAIQLQRPSLVRRAVSVIHPAPTDFLFGPDGNTNPGNSIFYGILSKHKTIYLKETKTTSSPSLLRKICVKDILKEFQTSTKPPGRFLQRERTGEWINVGYETAALITEGLIENVSVADSKSPSQSKERDTTPVQQQMECLLDAEVKRMQDKVDATVKRFIDKRNGALKTTQPDRNLTMGKNPFLRDRPKREPARRISMGTMSEQKILHANIVKQIKDAQIESLRARQLKQQYETQESNANETIALLNMYQSQLDKFQEMQQDTDGQREFFENFKSKFQLHSQQLQMQHKEIILKQQQMHRNEIKAMQEKEEDERLQQRGETIEKSLPLEQDHVKWQLERQAEQVPMQQKHVEMQRRNMQMQQMQHQNMGLQQMHQGPILMKMQIPMYQRQMQQTPMQLQQHHMNRKQIPGGAQQMILMQVEEQNRTEEMRNKIRQDTTQRQHMFIQQIKERTLSLEQQNMQQMMQMKMMKQKQQNRKMHLKQNHQDPPKRRQTKQRGKTLKSSKPDTKTKENRNDIDSERSMIIAQIDAAIRAEITDGNDQKNRSGYTSEGSLVI